MISNYKVILNAGEKMELECITGMFKVHKARQLSPAYPAKRSIC